MTPSDAQLVEIENRIAQRAAMGPGELFARTSLAAKIADGDAPVLLAALREARAENERAKDERRERWKATAALRERELAELRARIESLCDHMPGHWPDTIRRPVPGRGGTE